MPTFVRSALNPFDRFGGMLGCFAIAAIAIAVGCNRSSNQYTGVVTGTVTVGGELSKDGTIAFHPTTKSGKIAIGRIYHDGSFSLRTGQGNLSKNDGGTVAPDDYIVTISIHGPSSGNETKGEGGPPIPGPSLIAAKYARQETSPLRSNVIAGNNVFTFDLDRAVPGEEQPAEESTESESGAAGQPSDMAGKAAAAATESPAASENEKGAAK
jgi:hypothetical protein